MNDVSIVRWTNVTAMRKKEVGIAEKEGGGGGSRLYNQ